ncbi:hypothetical protein ACQEU5_25105 [Marinactinospora thermotolerans]|uniref:hypothetical protein n=1 Tax=Marinactinospora thermotolerans TaxID=531310 RepID=UPI003D936C48
MYYRYYRIDWEALNSLPPAEQMTALAEIISSVQRACSAARDRIVHRTIEALGTQRAAAQVLGMKPARTNQIAKETPVTVQIITCDTPAELYRRYPGQREAQPVYVEVDLRNRTVSADYDPEVGGGVPASVYHGFERRYPIPPLTSAAANELLERVRPLAERMCSDWEEHWDGDSLVAVLGGDALAAEAEVEALVGDPQDWGDHWDASERVTVWDVDGATNGDEVEEYGITAATTDEELEGIEEQILDALTEVSPSGEAVLEGVDEYLRSERDRLVEEARETLYWSLVEGAIPAGRAVDPEPAGLTVPDEVLSWAEGHGFGPERPDIYLLVATEEDAEDLDGEIDWMKTQADPGEAGKIRAALAQRDA